MATKVYPALIQLGGRTTRSHIAQPRLVGLPIMGGLVATRPLHVAGLYGTLLRLVESPARLVVFVHGFRGEPIATWDGFPGTGKWWDDSDLMFVGYDYHRDDVLGVANTLRLLLGSIYPQPPSEYLEAGGRFFRSENGTSYRELVMVGHSLGGYIVRRAVVDMIRSNPPGSGGVLANALANSGRMCLFSPATAGLSFTGGKARLIETLGLPVYEYVHRNPPALRDLKVKSGSDVLPQCQRLTQSEAEKHQGIRLLHPEVVWAQPDNVVVARDYDTDPPSHAQGGANHRTVCKPTESYPLPSLVVSTGRLPTKVDLSSR